MPTVEGLRFAYALHELPPGRWDFRRWRWELWHGAALLAAGWRLSRPQAERALRALASEHGHRLLGLRPPASGSEPADVRIPPGATVRLHAGPVTCLLVPCALAEEHALAG